MKLFLCVLFVLSLAIQAQAATVNLAWDPNSESDLDGYKVHYGNTSRTEGSYTTVVDIEDEAATTYRLTDMPRGTYYFSLTAYDTSKNESAFSNEVSAVVQGKAGEVLSPIMH